MLFKDLIKALEKSTKGIAVKHMKVSKSKEKSNGKKSPRRR